MSNKVRMSYRKAGLFLFSFGLISIFIGLLIPIHIHMKPNVFCFGISGFGVPFFVFGMSYVIWGERAAKRIGEPQNFKSWRILYWLPLAFIGLLTAFFVRWYMP
ncbi:hypothetical protein [Dyella monticola]|uniref:hypothetical protein n=1 Tax=Dyella monticola TaxID=1927958 RepID=UPI0011C01E95|nr:hypothetical protein [Dyella monticola]